MERTKLGEMLENLNTVKKLLFGKKMKISY